MLVWNWVSKQLFLHRFDNCSMFPYLSTPGFKVAGRFFFPNIKLFDQSYCIRRFAHNSSCDCLSDWGPMCLWSLTHPCEPSVAMLQIVGIFGCVDSDFFMSLLTEVHIACISSSTSGFLLFPTCQVRVVRFYVGGAAPPSPSSFFLLPPPSSSAFLAGPHLPALDRSGRRRTSSASSWSQSASPDFICQLLIAVGLAGLQPARVWALWARRTSTGKSLSAVGLAGLQPARFGALWASPDFNRRESERCGPRLTSTGEIRRAVGLAGLQHRMPNRMPEDLPDRMSDGMNWMPWWGSLEAKFFCPAKGCKQFIFWWFLIYFHLYPGIDTFHLHPAIDISWYMMIYHSLFISNDFMKIAQLLVGLCGVPQGTPEQLPRLCQTAGSASPETELKEQDSGGPGHGRNGGFHGDFIGIYGGLMVISWRFNGDLWWLMMM